MSRSCWPFTRVLRPSGPKTSKKSQNSLPGPSSLESHHKSPKKFEKPRKSLQNVLFYGLFDLLRLFQDSRTGGKTLLTLSGVFRPRGPRDSCKWPAGTQFTCNCADLSANPCEPQQAISSKRPPPPMTGHACGSQAPTRYTCAVFRHCSAVELWTRFSPRKSIE